MPQYWRTLSQDDLLAHRRAGVVPGPVPCAGAAQHRLGQVEPCLGLRRAGHARHPRMAGAGVAVARAAVRIRHPDRGAAVLHATRSPELLDVLADSVGLLLVATLWKAGAAL